MKDFDIVVRIGAIGLNEDEVIDQYRDVLSFIQENVPLDNFSIDIIEQGEFL